MKLRSHGSIAIAVAAVVMLGFLLPPLVNVNRYRGRIVSSMERALGRPVTVGTVNLRLFPQPGFDLGNVFVGEDPAFGHEPMLHAEEVQARLRLSSLWRGKLEIARLSLKYPSLNLVRANDGRWNMESLLQHASQIPTAPTTKARPESRPRFPYIEAQGGRINFKIGVEKKVYALSDADFALWLASEDELRTRLKGRMVRTDSYLSDTGQVTFNGRFQRASHLRDTPTEMEVTLEKSQLEQLTKFIDGQDHGWRGAVDANVRIAGRPTALKIAAQMVVNDFRRYDISTTEYVRLDARCSATLDLPVQRLADVSCRMPMGNGYVSLEGTVDGVSRVRSYDLNLGVAKVPAQSVVSLVRHAKRDIPDDLSATGSIDANLALRGSLGNAAPQWSGGGKTSDIVLRSAVLSPELALKPIEFAVGIPALAANGQETRLKANAKSNALVGRVTPENKLIFAPITLNLGSSDPTTVAGWVSPDGYSLSLGGEADLKRIFQAAQVAGIRAPQVNAEGLAKFVLSIGGSWRGFQTPKPLGSAQLQSVTVRLRGIAEPLRIASAALSLGQDYVTASDLSADFAQTNLALTGTVKFPRLCESLETCPVEFNLHSNQLEADDLNRLLNPRVAKRPWYAILGGRAEPSFLGRMNASGQITAGKVAIKSLVSNHVSAKASLSGGELVLSDLQGELWNGKHVGQWRLSFSGDMPTYAGTGTLDSVGMMQLSTLMHDNWATGKVSGSYKVSMSGDTAAQLLSSATGVFAFTWQDGSLRHLVLGNTSTPLNFKQFAGSVEFTAGNIRLAPESKMTTSSGIYQVSGTASPAREVDLTLRDGTRAYVVTGTLDKPKVTPAPARQAQVSLKQ